jgi:hypothetical protein
MTLLAGLLLIVLGIASLVVPIPSSEKQGIKIGDTNIGVQTSHSERVSPIISAVLIAGGIALTIAGGRTRLSKNWGDSQTRCSVQFWTIELSGRNTDRINSVPWLPLRWWKVAGNAQFGRFVLPMAARQANCPYLRDFRLFRDFILADRHGARNDRTITPVTGIGGEVKVLFSHLCPHFVKKIDYLS